MNALGKKLRIGRGTKVRQDRAIHERVQVLANHHYTPRRRYSPRDGRIPVARGQLKRQRRPGPFPGFHVGNILLYGFGFVMTVSPPYQTVLPSRLATCTSCMRTRCDLRVLGGWDCACEIVDEKLAGANQSLDSLPLAVADLQTPSRGFSSRTKILSWVGSASHSRAMVVTGWSGASSGSPVRRTR